MNERFKEVRKTLGLTQSEFGKSLGISNTAISKIEKGENNVSESNIISICREFGVNEEWLRTGVGGEDICSSNYLPMTRHITVLDMLWKMHQHPKRLR